MIRRPFGPTGRDVAVVGQGTWQVRDKGQGAAALRRGMELGMDHIDTAELYGGSEEMIAPVIEGRRDEVFLVSKVLPRNASYKGTLEACARSLQKLGTDHLDAYLLHWHEGRHPIGETMRAMGELMDRGSIRWAGVSNFDVHELEEAQATLGARKLACNQVLYHLQERGIESDVAPWCARHGVAVVGYSPFGSHGGFPTQRSRGGKALAAVAERLGRTPRQVALAFLTRAPGLFTIPKSENPAHTEENAGGAFELPAWAVEEIDEAFPVKAGLRFL